MSSGAEVCVDAGLVVKLVVSEADSEMADALFSYFANERVRLIAPDFLAVEADSILRQKVVVRNELTLEQAEAAFAKLASLPIQLLSDPAQRQRAWELSKKFNFATVYDATYIALAALRGCEFWTADRRLVSGVQTSLPFVKHLEEFSPTKVS